ncbi:MAG: T9SS type A sorting domain-containing protein [Calditrichia bacterium]
MNSFKTILFTLAAAFFCSGAFAQTVIQVDVASGLNNAIDFANANPGSADILELTDAGGEYNLLPVAIDVPMTIRGTDPANPPVIKADPSIAQNDFITINNDLSLDGIIIDGQAINGTYAQFKFMLKINNVPGTVANDAPELIVTNCVLRNVYQNGDPATASDGTIFDISRTSYADKVHFENTTLMNTGDEGVRSINAHKDPVHPQGTAIGSLVIRNCTFNNIRGSAVKVESDGDSTTYDGELLIENVTFYGCQRRVIWERDYANSIMRNIIIAGSILGNDNFADTNSLISIEREGSIVAHVDTFDIAGIKADGDTVTIGPRAFILQPGQWSGASGEGDVEWTTIYEYDPMFADPANGDFTLMAGSPCYRLGAGGTPIGDLRWATNPPPALTTISISPSDGLGAAIDFANANPGAADIIELNTAGGVYELAPTTIDVPLTIIGADPSNPPIIKAAAGIAQNDYITINADFTLRNVVVDGQTVSGDYAQFKYMLKVNNVPTAGLGTAPRIRVVNAELRNVYQSGDPATSTDGSIFDISRTSWVGSLHFEKVTFRNTGDEGIRSINAHKDPVHPRNGAYGAMIVRDCTFDNIKGSAIKIESDGDSLTADAPTLIEQSTFYNCASRVIWERDFQYTQIRDLIISDAQLGNDVFSGTNSLISIERFGSVVSHIDTFNIAGIKANGDTVTIGEPWINEGGQWSGSSDLGIIREGTMRNFDAQYVDAPNGNFQPQNAALNTISSKGGLIGDRHFGMITTGIVDDTRISALPQSFELAQNFPNPFNPVTTIQYSLQSRGKVTLEVYNLLGQVVATLVDEVRPAGEYSLTWDALNQASGVYFYRLQHGGNVQVRQMMLLK